VTNKPCFLIVLVIFFSIQKVFLRLYPHPLLVGLNNRAVLNHLILVSGYFYLKPLIATRSFSISNIFLFIFRRNCHKLNEHIIIIPYHVIHALRNTQAFSQYSCCSTQR
jgi:hypothetical protein